MAKLRSLSALKRTEPDEIPLARLPQNVMITRYAQERALAVNDLVRSIHGGSYEWYGFTLASGERPECIVDIGLPENDSNVHHYTGIGPENISGFRDGLPSGLIINGWIHSHGSIDFKDFSRTDEENSLIVLDYVGSYLRKPVSRREVVIEDLRVLTPEGLEDGDLGRGSVWVVTDSPVSQARIFETVYGCFCYAVLVGDSGWYRQEIYYRTRGILTGSASVTGRTAPILPVDSGRVFTDADRRILADEVREKIAPQDISRNADWVERG